MLTKGEFSWSSEGKLLKYVQRDTFLNGNSSLVFKYDDKGKLVALEGTDSEQLEYDKEGRLAKLTFKDSLGKQQESITYFYDSLNRVKKQRLDFPGDATMRTNITYLYDTFGNVVRAVFFTADNKAIGAYELKYDNKPNVYSSLPLYVFLRADYSQWGPNNPVKSTANLSGMDSRTDINTYEYNSSGYPVKSEQESNNESVSSSIYFYKCK